MITDNLFLYKNFKNGEILKNVLKVYDAINTEQQTITIHSIGGFTKGYKPLSPASV